MTKKRSKVVLPPVPTPDEIRPVSALFRRCESDLGVHDAALLLEVARHMPSRPETVDPFVASLFVAISYCCLDQFRESHGFEHSSDELLGWIKQQRACGAVSFDQFVVGDKVNPPAYGSEYRKLFERHGLV